MVRDDSSEESTKKKNVNNDEFHELNATGDDDDVTLASKEKPKIITKSGGSKSKVKTLKPEKKIKKRRRNSKSTIFNLLKSSILVGRWPKRKRNSVRIPAKRYKSSNVLGSSSLSEISQANISRSSSSSQPLVFPAMPNHNQQPLIDVSTMEVRLMNRYAKVEKRLSALKRKVFYPKSLDRDSPVPVPPNFASGPVTSTTLSDISNPWSSIVQSQSNATMPSYHQPSSPRMEDLLLLDYFRRNANVEQDVLNQRFPLSSTTLSEISNSSSSSVQSQSNATMPSPEQQHQPSYSPMSLPQDSLPNTTSATEFGPNSWRRQLPSLRIGVDLVFPPNGDDEEED